jgi:hypothetical protein
MRALTTDYDVTTYGTILQESCWSVEAIRSLPAQCNFMPPQGREIAATTTVPVVTGKGETTPVLSTSNNTSNKTPSVSLTPSSAGSSDQDATRTNTLAATTPAASNKDSESNGTSNIAEAGGRLFWQDVSSLCARGMIGRARRLLLQHSTAPAILSLRWLPFVLVADIPLPFTLLTT